MSCTLSLIIMLLLLRESLNFDSRIEPFFLSVLFYLLKCFLNFSSAHNPHLGVQKSVVHSNLHRFG